jgi:tol-pal system protein YbgF
MKSLYIVVLTLTLMPAGFSADKKTLLDVSRDIADVQDQVRQLQRTVDEKLAVIQTQIQQARESAGSADKGVAILESGLRNAINDQMTKVSAPMVNLSTKIDQMSTDFAALSNSVADLTQRMTKLQTQVNDLSNTLKVMQAPPSPPPGTTDNTGAPANTSTGPAAGGTPPAGLPPARDLYDAAQRDRSGGNFDLAMQEFTQYLKWYGTTPLAPNAQFFVGQIYYDKGDFASAIKSFDTVLERYPENNKTPDATYMKGMALWKSGQATAAGRTFLDVIQKYPKSDVAPKARDARKALGLSVPSASTGSKSARKRKR